MKVHPVSLLGIVVSIASLFFKGGVAWIIIVAALVVTIIAGVLVNKSQNYNRHINIYIPYALVMFAAGFAVIRGVFNMLFGGSFLG